MLAGLCTLLSVFVPETYAPVLFAQKAKRLRMADPVNNKDVYAESDRVSWTFLAILERTIFRPFKMQLVEPILLLVTIYISLAYGVMYASMCVTSPPKEDISNFLLLSSVRGGPINLYRHTPVFGLE